MCSFSLRRETIQAANVHLRFNDFDYFAALVDAAVRASPVGPDSLMAVGALGHLWRPQRIVRPSRRGAALRVASFRIWHVSFLLSLDS
jgi:hypothetical protein